MKIIGSGEIEEVTKGKVYRIRHHLGRDPKTGRYIRSPKKTVYGTKADARRALEDYRIEFECGVKNPEELTVGSYARAWYERRVNSGRYSPLTLKVAEASNKKEEPEKPALSEADKAAIAQRMADGALLEAAISAVRPDASVLDLLGL